MLSEQVKLVATLRHTARKKNTLLLLTCVSSLLIASAAGLVNKTSKSAFYALTAGAMATLATGCVGASRLERKEEEMRRQLTALQKELANSRC